jgi:hypothetical protein
MTSGFRVLTTLCIFWCDRDRLEVYKGLHECAPYPPNTALQTILQSFIHLFILLTFNRSHHALSQRSHHARRCCHYLCLPCSSCRWRVSRYLHPSISSNLPHQPSTRACLVVTNLSLPPHLPKHSFHGAKKWPPLARRKCQSSNVINPPTDALSCEDELSSAAIIRCGRKIHIHLLPKRYISDTVSLFIDRLVVSWVPQSQCYLTGHNII